VTDLVSLKLDSQENHLAIELNLPVQGGVGYAAYEEIIDFDEQDVPGYLIDACRRLYEASVRAVRERVYTDREVPCATCTGNCCGRQFSSVRLTAEDVERIRGVVDIEAQVIMYDEVSFSGYAGEFNLVPWFGDEEQNACPNLTPEGCGIYEHRPLICREYSPWDCDIYEADPDKVEGKVKHKLKVVE
jgi:Fe-S-cluster containining protein